MIKRTRFLAVLTAIFLTLPGCKSSSSMMDQASGLMGLANGIPEISQFMSLAKLGGLASMLGGSPATLLAPSNDALSALGGDALDRLKSPAGADDLKKLLQSSIVQGTPSPEELASELNGANILKSAEGDGGVVRVIDKVPGMTGM
jgi:uncharacterized surface protein with fasciclin (FAS1) repeats